MRVAIGVAIIGLCIFAVTNTTELQAQASYTLVEWPAPAVSAAGFAASYLACIIVLATCDAECTID